MCVTTYCLSSQSCTKVDGWTVKGPVGAFRSNLSEQNAIWRTQVGHFQKNKNKVDTTRIDGSDQWAASFQLVTHREFTGMNFVSWFVCGECKHYIFVYMNIVKAVSVFWVDDTPHRVNRWASRCFCKMRNYLPGVSLIPFWVKRLPAPNTSHSFKLMLWGWSLSFPANVI